MLGRIARRGDRRRGRESKAVVVAMIANEHTALCAARSQILKACLDQLLADTTPLKRGLHGDRTKRKPTPQHIGSNLGECDVANNLLADHGDERQGERFGLAQRVDDSRFGSVAERKTGKRPRGQRANGGEVGGRFWANENSYARPVAQGPLNSARRPEQIRLGILGRDPNWLTLPDAPEA